MHKHLAMISVAMAWAALPLLAQDDDLFGKLDTNRDGYVSSDEVREPQQALFERLLRTADKNADGKLSKEEFQAGLKPEAGARPPLGGGPGFPGGRPGEMGEAREAFRRLDQNRDGKLTDDELPPPMRQNLARVDRNGDGSVSEDEFAPFFLGRQRPAGDSPPGGRPGQGLPPLDRGQLETLFDRTDANSDGKLTKEEIPEERQGMRSLLERSGGDSISKDQFVRGMLAMGQALGQPGRPDGGPARPDGGPPRRPDGPPGPPPGAGLLATLDADRDGQLSNAEIVGAGLALLRLDRNGDGKLTPEELFGPGGGRPGARPGDGPPQGRPGVGPPAARPGEERRPGQRGLGGMNPEEFRQRLKEADANNDGKLSKEEAPPLLRQRFDQIDANSDGFVDEAEVRQLLRRMADGAERRPEKK